MATIGWIDFSTEDRNRVGSVLDLLKPEGMVDELGLGTIRDALANQMFPGISTIQTRAKYFFIIPYILYDYQMLTPSQRKGKTASQYLEERENEMMWQLAEDYRYEERHGVIGITKKRGEKIVRRPSAVYWNGLATFQFIDTQGMSSSVFLKQVTSPNLESLLARVDVLDDVGRDDVDAAHENLFRIMVAPKPGWSKGLTLELDKDEGDAFEGKVKKVGTGKLIAALLEDEKLWDLFRASKNFLQFSEAANSTELATGLRDMLTLAHDFSELMYGAHIAYNCQLQRVGFQSGHFDQDWEEWLQGIRKRMLDFDHFNPERLFSFALTAKSGTMQFVRQWWHLIQSEEDDLVLRDRLVRDQEGAVKGHKARLKSGKMDDVKENSWIGLRQFDYRFFQATTILNDIRTGLNNQDATSQTK